MNKYEFSKDEIEYLKEIYSILKGGEFPALFFKIGYDKVTGERKIFLFYKEEENGEETTYAIAEIISENNRSIKNMDFMSDEDQSINYRYGRSVPWWKFWNRLTQR